MSYLAAPVGLSGEDIVGITFMVCVAFVIAVIAICVMVAYVIEQRERTKRAALTDTPEDD